MKIASFVLFMFFIFSKVNAQIYTSDNVSVHFFAPAPITNIDAVSNLASAILNETKKEVKITIPISSFNFKKALMQQHFNEIHLESKKHPTAFFKGNYKENINLLSDGNHKITLIGKLNVHGVNKEVSLPCQILIKKEEITFNTNFIIASKDYKIKLPIMLNKEVGQEIEVTVNGVLKKNK